MAPSPLRMRQRRGKRTPCPTRSSWRRSMLIDTHGSAIDVMATDPAPLSTGSSRSGAIAQATNRHSPESDSSEFSSRPSATTSSSTSSRSDHRRNTLFTSTSNARRAPRRPASEEGAKSGAFRLLCQRVTRSQPTHRGLCRPQVPVAFALQLAGRRRRHVPANGAHVEVSLMAVFGTQPLVGVGTREVIAGYTGTSRRAVVEHLDVELLGSVAVRGKAQPVEVDALDAG